MDHVRREAALHPLCEGVNGPISLGLRQRSRADIVDNARYTILFDDRVRSPPWGSRRGEDVDLVAPSDEPGGERRHVLLRARALSRWVAVPDQQHPHPLMAPPAA